MRYPPGFWNVVVVVFFSSFSSWLHFSFLISWFWIGEKIIDACPQTDFLSSLLKNTFYANQFDKKSITKI
jgi:hypothetical protein